MHPTNICVVLSQYKVIQLDLFWLGEIVRSLILKPTKTTGVLKKCVPLSDSAHPLLTGFKTNLWQTLKDDAFRTCHHCITSVFMRFK